MKEFIYNEMMVHVPLCTHKEPQNILTVPILEGLDGKEKMSKSLNNYIAVLDTPQDVFGKTMSLPDNLMAKYFELITDLTAAEYTEILAGHPRDAKLRLASEITTLLHDQAAAEAARQEFLNVFQKGDLPDEMPQLSLAVGSYTIWDIVIKSALCQSNGEARRMIEQGAVRWNGQKISNPQEQVEVTEKAAVLRVGKRKFMEIAG